MRTDSFMGIRRFPLEVTFAILEVCRTPIILTHLMYKSNVSGTTLKSHTKLLIAHNMLKTVSYDYKNRTEGRRVGIRYEITSKGLEFLKVWQKVVDLWNEEFPQEK